VIYIFKEANAVVRKKIAGSIAALVALSMFAVGCGAANNTSNNATTNTDNTTGATQHSNFKVGLVTDIGGLNDHGFNYLADQGLEKAKKDFGITADVVQSKSAADYVPNLSNYARQGYNLVIAVGFLMHDAVEQVAAQYPNTKFLIIDSEITDKKNVTSALFRTEQCGYLVGVMAGLLEQQKGIKGLNPQNVLGVIGGQEIPPVDSYIAGFQQGVKAVDPNGKVIVKYTNKFDDPNLGSNFAQSEISQGADILFQVAGGTGVGVIDAAKSAGVYAIGVDANQNYLAPSTVITSAMKGIDTATYDVIKQTMDNTFKQGDQFFDLSNNGVGIAPANSVVPKDIIDKVNQYAEQIKSGKIKVSATVTK
jgi:basic membrane protein A and related proteins